MFEQNIDRVLDSEARLANFFTPLSKNTRPRVTMKTCEEIAYKLYSMEVERLGNKIRTYETGLESRSKEQRRVRQKENEVKHKERIILRKDEKITRLSKEVESWVNMDWGKKGKRNVKRRSKKKAPDKKLTEIQVDQLPIEEIRNHSYDIPGHCRLWFGETY